MCEDFDILAYLMGKQAGGGGGGSSYTLLAEKDYTIEHSVLTDKTIGSVSCGAAGWTDAAMIYVRIRDKAGPRNGYFYGSDTFIINERVANGETTGLANGSCGRALSFDSEGVWKNNVITDGVYAYSAIPGGSVDIHARASSSSLTIDGVYHVEVYLLKWPDDISPFDE